MLSKLINKQTYRGRHGRDCSILNDMGKYDMFKNPHSLIYFTFRDGIPTRNVSATSFKLYTPDRIPNNA